MDVGAVVLLGNELALQRRVDVIANNLANAQTNGFRRGQTVFRTEVETMSEAESPAARTVHHVLDYGAAFDTTQGAFQPTGNPLDLAIGGAGLFAVQLPDGSRAYSRQGSFTVDEQGAIVNRVGKLVGEGGKALTAPLTDVGRISVGTDGTISGPSGAIGRIALFDTGGSPSDPRGDGFVTAPAARELGPEETRLRSGGLEASNVQPVTESAALIEAMRAYQSSQHMTESWGDLRRRAIERLGRQ